MPSIYIGHNPSTCKIVPQPVYWCGKMSPFVSDPLNAEALHPSHCNLIIATGLGGKRPPDKRRLSANSEL